MVLWRLVTRGLGVISTLVLAHVLVPQDFGIVAIATTYVIVFDSLSTIGVQDAIIRSSHVGEDLHDAAFTLSIIRAALNSFLVVVSAPLAAAFFDEPRLTNVLYVLAALALLEGFENVGIVDFRREMRFDKDFQLFLFPRLVAVVVTISCALIFGSYWALVCGIASQRVVRLAATYLLHPYRPSLSLAGWRQISSFSFWTWAASIAGLARDRCWTLIIGRYFDSASVGIFTMASEIGLLPISEFIYPICRALFAGFALARHQGSSLGPAFVRTIGVVALVAMPAAIGISAVGNYVIDAALGDKWGNAVSIMQIISATAPFYLLTAVGGTVLNASGNIRYNFWIVAVSAVVGIVASMLMAIAFGLIGIALATGLLMVVEGILFAIIAARSVKVTAGEMIYRLWRPLAAAVVMALALWLTKYGWQNSAGSAGANMKECGIAIAIGAVSYIGSILVFWLISFDKDPLEMFLVNTIRRSLARGPA